MRIDKKDWWTIIYLILITVMLIISLTNINGRSADEIGYYENISAGWKRVIATEGAEIQYEITLPRVQCSNPALAIKTAWAEFDVEMGGETIFKYEDPEHVNGANYVLIPLEDGCAGEKIVVRSYKDASLLSRAVKYKTYYGEKYSVYRGIFRRNTLSFILFALFISNCFLIWITMFRFRKSISNKTTLMFWYQSLFSLSFGCWLIADSDFIGFVMNAPRTATYLTYFSLYLMPVCALLFIEKLYVYEVPGIRLYEFLFIALTIGVIALKELHIVEFYKSVNFMLGFYVGFSIWFVLGALKDILIYKNKLMKNMMLGIPALVGTLILAVISYRYLHSDYYGHMVAIGILIFMIFPYVETVRLAKGDQEFERLIRDIKIEKKIDIATGMKNLVAFKNEDEKNRDGNMIYIFIHLHNYESVRVEEGYQTSADLIKNTTDAMFSVFKNAGEYYRLSKELFLLQIKRNSMNSIDDMLFQFSEELKTKCQQDDIPLILAGSVVVGCEGITNEELLSAAVNNEEWL